MLHLAAALMVLVAIAHSYLGERYILIRLFKRDDLPKVFGSTAFTTGTLRFVWHLVTVAWFGIAAVVAQASGPSIDSAVVLRVFAITAFVSSLFALFFTRGKHLSWVAFFVMAALIWLGSSRS